MTCTVTDAAELDKLYRKYVGRGSVDIKRLKRVIRHEASIAERGVIKVSRGLVTELRSDRAKIGRIAKRCSEVRQ